MESGCYDSQHPGSSVSVWVISIASVSVVTLTVTSGPGLRGRTEIAGPFSFQNILRLCSQRARTEALPSHQQRNYLYHH